jgi:Protein of unknown function (DUF2934)
MNRWQLEEFINARSYAIWEREGRVGSAEEHWDRACQEIEDEVRAAIEGKPQYVLPRLGISQRPIRYETDELSKAA